MRATLQRVGDSRGIILPPTVLARLGIVDAVDLVVEDDRIVITKASALRVAAEAPVAIAASGVVDDDAVWLEAPSAADGEATIWEFEDASGATEARRSRNG